MTKLIDIQSSNGVITIDHVTGTVRKVTLYPDGDLPAFTRFDVAEWRSHYDKLDLPDEIDILDIGYWYIAPSFDDAEEYEEPAHEWREERERMQAGEEVNYNRTSNPDGI